MRDLEIRGAGDLLGAEQSGHVAAVGFELYVELLGEAVAELTGARRAVGAARAGRRRRSMPTCRLRTSTAEAQKIDLHRRLALAESEDELRELHAAAEDRYGAGPGARREPLRDPGGQAEAGAARRRLPRRCGAGRRRSVRSSSAPASCASCADSRTRPSTRAAPARGLRGRDARSLAEALAARSMLCSNSGSPPSGGRFCPDGLSVRYSPLLPSLVRFARGRRGPHRRPRGLAESTTARRRASGRRGRARRATQRDPEGATYDAAAIDSRRSRAYEAQKRAFPKAETARVRRRSQGPRGRRSSSSGYQFERGGETELRRHRHRRGRRQRLQRAEGAVLQGRRREVQAELEQARD